MSLESTVSVIVPTRNRPDALRACLQSLAECNFPRDRFDVVVIDDGGSFRLDDLIGMFSGSLKVSLVKQTSQGGSCARNKGAEQSQGRFVVFADDDCVFSPEWLQCLVAELEEHPECLVGGKVCNGLSCDIYAETVNRIESYLYQVYNRDPANARFLGAASMAASRDRFMQVGGFDPRLQKPFAAEDRDFCDRWHMAGWTIRYVSSAVSYHNHGYSLRSFIGRCWRDGIGSHRLRCLRKRRGGDSRLESAGFYRGLVRSVSASSSSCRRRIVALLLVSQAIVALGYLYGCVFDLAPLEGEQE